MRQHGWYHSRALVSSYVATLQGPYYFVKTNHILKLRQQMLKAQYSEIESRKLEWFQIINYSFALVFIIGGISTIVKSTYLDPYLLYMAYHAVIAISLFYILLMIYKYPIVFTRLEADAEIFNEIDPMFAVVKETPLPYKLLLSGENDSEKEKSIIAKLEKIMEEQKLYKNPNFSLNDLAGAISESRNTISHTLNTSLHKTFYNYINELRIAECKRLLADDKLHRLTIEGIAAESGFKSMSVFYKFFKEIENVTPAVYRKQASSS
ncbi:MAG: helix-turn-helix domain-containing protein [Bacteroidales bacterium]|nr:helix-turn-helix domain-containing protein [Bacteroidales bacterium]